MPLHNTTQRFGAITIALHWLVAVTVFGLFVLGLWMSGLTLYHPWYHRAPELHKSIGLLLFAVMVVRLLWRLGNPYPAALLNHTRREHLAAALVHWLLYLLLFATIFIGFLIATAEGGAVYLFSRFSVPALFALDHEQAELVGKLHAVLAYTVIALALLHAAAAIKHHVIDRDRTLQRMLGR